MTVKKTETTSSEAAPLIQIHKLDSETLHVPIVGTAPLIVHNFGEKARREILDRQQGKKKVKVSRDPQAEYESAFYKIASDDGDRYGFPVTGFKEATAGAARFYDKSVSITALRQFLFFKGIVTKLDRQMLVEIFGEPEMQEDVVRLSGPSRSADLRYRPVFHDWSATLNVSYFKPSIDRTSVLSLIDAGGMAIGVGEWRPERKGVCGTYRIDPDKEIEVES